MKNINYKNKPLLIITLASLLLIGMTGCKKFVEVPPPDTQLVQESVFANDAAATSAVLGIYNRMITTQGISDGGISLSLLGGLLADEFQNFSTQDNQVQFFTNSLQRQNQNVYLWWQELYRLIYQANAVIEGLENSKDISNTVKQQLDGEAKFIRAFCHFHLVNLYGDVPLVNTTNYQQNAVVTRTSQQAVYESIINDLKIAQGELNDNYVSPLNQTSTERSRPNKWTATALLARTYLYNKKFDSAEIQATAIINNSAKYGLVTPLNNVFLKNSKEAIWQLQPVAQGYNTFNGSIFILSFGPNDFLNNVSLTDTLYKSFEPGDARKTSWVNSYFDGTRNYYYSYKYKIDYSPTVTEYFMVMRLAEQYLIRAEARAMQNNFLGALSDLNAIRTRAGLPNSTASTQADLLNAIERERQVELFSEWGHRWFDLKRTNRADAVLGIIKGSNWQPTDKLMPIPQLEMQNNPKLTPQNPGY